MGAIKTCLRRVALLSLLCDRGWCAATEPLSSQDSDFAILLYKLAEQLSSEGEYAMARSVYERALNRNMNQSGRAVL